MAAPGAVRERLRALANAATTGPWFGPRITDNWPPGWVGIYAADEHGTPLPGDIVGVTGRYDEATAKDDAAYIAAVDPTTVLALLDDLDRLARQVEVAERVAKSLHFALDNGWAIPEDTYIALAAWDQASREGESK